MNRNSFKKKYLKPLYTAIQEQSSFKSRSNGKKVQTIPLKLNIKRRKGVYAFDYCLKQRPNYCWTNKTMFSAYKIESGNLLVHSHSETLFCFEIYSKHISLINYDLRGSVWDIKTVQPWSLNSMAYCQEQIKATLLESQQCPLVSINGNSNIGVI